MCFSPSTGPPDSSPPVRGRPGLGGPKRLGESLGAGGGSREETRVLYIYNMFY